MRSILLHTLIAIALASCSGSHENSSGTQAAIPRRHAYPRIALPDSAFTAVDAKEVTLQVNSAVIDSIVKRNGDNGAVFIDIRYPNLHSAIYITITPVSPSSIAGVIANRIERVGLNLGDSNAEMIDFDNNAGFESKMFVTRADISTPVQFISTDGRDIVVSGVAYVADASKEHADSLSPVTAMMRRDILHLLKTLE